MDLTEAPVIASHSSCRHFLKGFERNIDDDMIKKVAKNGGVVQVNFGSTFISAKSRDWRTKLGSTRGKYLAEHELAGDAPESGAFTEGYNFRVVGNRQQFS